MRVTSYVIERLEVVVPQGRFQAALAYLSGKGFQRVQSREHVNLHLGIIPESVSIVIGEKILNKTEMDDGTRRTT